MDPYLRIEEGKATLVASSGQNAVSIPVVVNPEDQAGSVPLAALKELRKIKDGNLELTDQYAVLPSGAAFPRSQFPSYPPIEQIFVQPGAETVDVAFSAKALYELCCAMGCDVIKLRIPVVVENVGDSESYQHRVTAHDAKVLGVVPHGSEPHIAGAVGALLSYQVARI